MHHYHRSPCGGSNGKNFRKKVIRASLRSITSAWKYSIASVATLKNVNVPRLAFPLDGEQPVFGKRILKWPPRMGNVEARSVMTTKVVDETEIAVASTIAPCLELHPKCASFRSGLQIVVTK